jgi:NAD(P)H-hydrate epimerase
LYRSVDSLLDIVPKTPDAVAIGMGLSVKEPESLIHLIRQFLAQNSESKNTRLLLDASALIPEILEDISGTNTIITPHLGEYKRIFNTNLAGLTIEEQISDVSRNASKYGITIILKGYYNIICEGQSRRVEVIKRSTPAMTVGGTGDVLSGVSVALLAKMTSPFYASVLGVYFVGLAASVAVSKLGLHIVATDIIDELAVALKPFDKVKCKNNSTE